MLIVSIPDRNDDLIFIQRIGFKPFIFLARVWHKIIKPSVLITFPASSGVWFSPGTNTKHENVWLRP